MRNLRNRKSPTPLYKRGEWGNERLFPYIDRFDMKLVIWIETESLHFLVHGCVEDGLENIDPEGLFSYVLLDLLRDSVAFFSVPLGNRFFDPPI